MSSSDFQSNGDSQKLSQGSANISNSYYNQRPATYKLSERDMLECSPDRHGNPSWYSDQGRGRDWHNHNYRDLSHFKKSEEDVFSKTFINSPTAENSHQNFVSSHLRNSSMEPIKRFPFENKFHFNQDLWRHEMHRHDSNANSAMFPGAGNSNSSSGLFDNHLYTVNEERYSFENTNMNFMYGQAFYKPLMPMYPLSPISSNFNNSPAKESAHYSDSIYGNNVQNMYSSSPGHANSGARLELLHRKHGTSFEHEQPVPYSSNECSSSDLKSISNSPSRGDCKSEGGGGFQEMTLTLHRQENGFGFRIIGGTEEGSQVSVQAIF